jgi:biotin carboxylase
MRTLWIVSGGKEAVPGIKRAKQLGLRVVVSDGDPSAPGFRFADEHFVVSTYDVEEHIRTVSHYHRNRFPVDGVLSMAADVPLTVASIAEELGVAGIPLDTARLASDKFLMKRHFAACGVPIPWFRSVQNLGEFEEVARQRELPLILKPVDSRGGRGVLRITRNTQLAEAFEISRSASPSQRVMVEEFLQGPQISTESILLDNCSITPGFSDRNYEYLDRFSPYVVENGGTQPTRLNADDQAAVVETAEKAARSLSLSNWTVKGDLVFTSQGPKVIEMAPRLSGGWFATDQIPLFAGVDIVAVAIRLALGETVEPDEIRPRKSDAVAIRYFFPPPGKVVSIAGLEDFQDQPWVHRLSLSLKPGDRVEPITDHTKRVGFVITTGPTRATAVRRAERVIDGVELQIDPT